MGGLLILVAFVVSTLLWMPLSNPYLWPVLLVVIAFGGIGGVDDWINFGEGRIMVCRPDEMGMQLFVGFGHSPLCNSRQRRYAMASLCLF